MRPLLTVDVRRRMGSFELAAAFTAGQGITVLFGPSGAGKSALLSIIAGASRPDTGTIVLDGEPLFDDAQGVDQPPEARGVGWVFQDARLFPHLTVEENLRYGLRRTRGRQSYIGFDEVLAALGLEGLLTRRPRHLSGGEAQRIALGRALLGQPRLLLLDEPLTALDAARKTEILRLVEGIRDRFGVPMIYVTHSLGETVRLADRLVVLQAGRVAAEGCLSDVLAQADIPALAERADVGAAVEAVVDRHDPERGVTVARASAVEWVCPHLDAPVGARVRLAVLARDVIIALVRPMGLSARNIIYVRIDVLTPRPDGAILVRLLAEDQPLLALVTPDSVDALGLRPGLEAWAVVKSVALEGVGRHGLSSAFDA